jgi:uncharacterized protein YaiI (UPF0178 family)
MQIFVDADGFPTAAKDLLIRTAIRLHVPLVFVANKKVNYEPSVIISTIIVSEGPDLADDRIVELAQKGDLVITADIPLADRVVAKGAFALNPRGHLYTDGNIKDKLAMRDLMTVLREGGMMTGGPSVYGKKECQAFVNQIDSFLTKYLKHD